MQDDDGSGSVRERALAQLAEFRARVLPAILRRVAHWKGIRLATLDELREDVGQELTVDCLEHAREVVEASAAARHTRWIRLAERWVYRQYVRPHRRASAVDEQDVAATAEPAELVREVAPELGPSLPLVRLKNGRCNLRASAARAGSNVRAIRRQLHSLAERLDDGGEAAPFWHRRLAEALTGLGADLLRGNADLGLLVAPRRPPDPARRLRRVRRLAARFPLHRTPMELRKILAYWRPARAFSPRTARVALEQATRVWPTDRGGWLWLFEASLATGDLPAAANAVRRGRQCAERDGAGRPCSAFVLARARLLEARGRRAAGWALIRRANGRAGDARLRRVVAAIDDRSAIS